ncbi:MAG: hypothetical protein E7077_04520 [Bacteroidales bacterium]|jgi:hypothetical protein|nr:hypothetical protein [Bacteroidales bacterium]
MGMDNSNKQTSKARLGSIGENLVVVKLLEQGWDAFNANCSIKNFKSIDIVCLDSSTPESKELWWKPKTTLVQVKTSVEKNITTGFSIEEALDKDNLWKMVKGPYVFVSAQWNKESETYSFRYFILSRSQFVNLLYEAHYYYVKIFHKDRNLVLSAPAGFNISWLEGDPEFSPKNKVHFGNPLTESCENKWNNIWEE